MASRRVYLYHKVTPTPDFGRFWLIFVGCSQILPWTKLFPMDFNKVVLPWQRKSWSKRHGNTMRMLNNAKLATWVHQGYIEKHMSQFLHWSVTLVPVASCAQAAIWVGDLAHRVFWFLVCYAATQLATQLRQRCIQVVRSNKEARKRLTESNSTPAMDFGCEKIRKRKYTQTKNRTKHTTTIIIQFN